MIVRRRRRRLSQIDWSDALNAAAERRRIQGYRAEGIGPPPAPAAEGIGPPPGSWDIPGMRGAAAL